MISAKRLLEIGAILCSVGAFALSGAPSAAWAEEAVADWSYNKDYELSDAQITGLEILEEEGEVAQATSARTSVGKVTDVTIGNGFLAITGGSIDQQDVYSKALQQVKRWRQDALDSGIKVKYKGSFVSIDSCLSSMGMTRSEYLNPSWSNALERIALQRSVEAADVDLGHTRTDGTSCFTASYNGYTSSSEIIAWNSGDITAAINNWASEKQTYIRYTNGESVTDQYGHYQTLIDPSYKAFGFAQGAPAIYKGYSMGNTFVGEASSSALGGATPLGIKGDYNFTVSISPRIISSNNIVHTLPNTGLAVGQKLDYVIYSGYMNYRYQMVCANITFADSSIAKASGYKITALKRGTTTLNHVDDIGNYLSTTLKVRSFSDANSDTAHLDDIDWLADKGISTGWANADGTKSFQPYSNVARADMAAFLYRLAGSPKYTAPNKSLFKDVTANTPHYKEICWLAEKGISTGWSVAGGKEFRPYAAVARCDMAAFLYRLAGSPSYTVPSKSPFKDCTAAGTPHYKEVCWLASTGVSAGWEVSGGKEFRSHSTVARADMAALLHRMSTKGLVPKA